MNLPQLFRSYELSANRADEAFLKMENEHPACIKCELYCSDCCHAVFGLFMIEAAYIQHHFSKLDSQVRRKALLRGDEADRDLRRLEQKLRRYKDDPRMSTVIMAKERIRCPLLDETQQCVLYPHRPVTCHVYGIPTAIQGKARVCGKTAFKGEKSYPLFDLDSVHRDLFALSKELLESAGNKDLDRASFLISVSKAINTPLEDLLNETLEESGRNR